MPTNTQSYKRFKYRRPPIVEAIFEVKFTDDNFDSAVPGQIYEKICNKFPKKKDLKKIILSIGGPARHSQTPPDFRTPHMQAWNQLDNQCLQVGPGIIAANDCSYESWELFLPAIQMIVNSYIEVVSPQEAQSVGLRFINRILIPEDTVLISNFFKVGIVTPPIMSNAHSFDVTLSLKKDIKEFKTLTKVRFASDALKNGESGVAFILDLDVQISNIISADITKITEAALAAHNHIGAIFEDLILPSTRKILGGQEI